MASYQTTNTREPIEPVDPATTIIDKDSYKKELRNEGLPGLREKVKKDLDNWRNIELHVAVTGSAGSGKSLFIIAVRRLRATDKGAAKVGTIKETTLDFHRYIHPEDKSFILIDLPGVGTQNQPRSKYLENVKFGEYEFFIIMSKGRFTEDDAWLVQEIQKQKKKFYFVRTNVDKDIEDDRHDDPEHHTEQKVLTQVKEYTDKKLRELGVKDPKVFLINNHAVDKYDFGMLHNALLDSNKGLKMEAMALALATVTTEIMEEKKKFLMGRIENVAMLVTCTECEDDQKRTFQDEIKFYQKQFNINDDILMQNSDFLSLSQEEIRTFEISFDEQDLEKEIQVKSATKMRQEESWIARFIDWFRSNPKNKLIYGFCLEALKKNLIILYDKACQLYDSRQATQMVDEMSKYKRLST